MAYKGETKLGKLFQSRRERGKNGLPTLSVTMTNGLINRDDLNRKTDTNLSPEEHLLVQKDDIAYNMMRMWQGASGLAKKDGIISPAYIVLKPIRVNIDPLFASYLFKSKRMIYLFWAYSYGLTGDRLRLYFNDFKRIPINVPTIPEQRKIAHILSTWDTAIETIEKLIENNQQKKTALMQQLLTGKKRLSGFTGKWKEEMVGNRVKLNGGFAFKSNQYKQFGCPIIRIANIQGGVVTLKDAPSYTPDPALEQYKVCSGDILIAMSGATTGKIGRYLPNDNKDEAYLNQRVGKFTNLNKKKTNLDYRYYVVQSEKFQNWITIDAIGGAQPNVSGKQLEKLKLQWPSVEEQLAISKVLINCENEFLFYTNLKNNCIQQKNALMQQLLTGKRRVKIEQ
jgi:type I restriction enzyme, S subunit